MKIEMKRMFMILGLVAAFCAGPVQATPIGYTDNTDYRNALVMPDSILDFNGMASGTLISDGQAIDGITFDYPVLANYGVSMMVTDYFELGTDDGEMFQDGDAFDLAFSPASAVGMVFISGDEMYDDDIVLTAGSGAVGLDVADGVFSGRRLVCLFSGNHRRYGGLYRCQRYHPRRRGGFFVYR